MPTYELALVLRVMPREEIFSCLKRTATEIFNRGGFLRNINNIGKHPTPYKMSGEYGPHREANYYVIEFDSATYSVPDLKKVYTRDVDIVRQRIFKVNPPATDPCTLEDELKPPMYRKEVQDMIEIALKKKSYKPARAWDFNTGLSYHPFQR